MTVHHLYIVCLSPTFTGSNTYFQEAPSCCIPSVNLSGCYAWSDQKVTVWDLPRQWNHWSWFVKTLQPLEDQPYCDVVFNLSPDDNLTALTAWKSQGSGFTCITVAIKSPLKCALHGIIIYQVSFKSKIFWSFETSPYSAVNFCLQYELRIFTTSVECNNPRK